MADNNIIHYLLSGTTSRNNYFLEMKADNKKR